MKVYFAGSITGGRDYVWLFEKIVNELKKQKIKVLTPHVADKKLNQKGENLPPKLIFSRDKKLIEECDFMVAEVSQPSHGVGGEIVYALVKEKPVLALFYKNSENRLSAMIAGNPSDNLYLEHYDEDNLPLILKNFVSHIKKQKDRRGKLIVIEGGDGSGKTTQAQLLFDYLKKQKIAVKLMDFPRYYTSFHGRIVGRFLAGEFGKLDEVSPYLASLAYALDRAGAKEEMDDWLKKGGIIISNRYATSSMAHQGARLPEEKRKEFLEWLDELEYKVHKIPREDLVIYLYVPWQIGLELSKKKEKGYIKGLDIAEKDLKHRQEAEKMYLWLAKTRKNWVKIDCCQDGKIFLKEKIHQEILKILKERRVI